MNEFYNEKTCREFLRLIHSPALVLGENLEIKYSNEGFSSLFDKHVNDLEGIEAKKLFQGFTDSETLKAAERLLTSGEYAEVEDQFKGFYWKNQICRIPGGVLILFDDISTLKMVEEELGRSGKKTEALLNAIPDLMFQIARDGTFLNYKGEANSLLEVNDQNIGMPISQVFNPELTHIINNNLKRAFEQGEIQQFEFQQGDRNQVKYYEGRMVLSGENLVLVIIRDITEQKESQTKLIAYQQKLRSLATRLSLVEEEERRRIANILHDHIGQALALSNIRLEKLRDSVNPPDCIGEIDEVLGTLRSVIQETRDLTWELSPTILYELGLGAAVEELLCEIGKKHDLRIKYQEQGDAGQMDNNIRSMLFQGVRELLVNVVKHAKAKELAVQITRQGNNIQVHVRDDGIGFNLDELRSGMSKGFGLFNIRERLDYIGGNFYLESEPGKGTRIILSAPIATQDKLEGDN